MNTIHIQYFKTLLGTMVLGGFESKLCLCDWLFRKNRTSVDTRIKKGLNASFTDLSSEIIELAKIQLEEYFQGHRKIFNLPLLMIGTDFQKVVWNELLQIPYGKTETYQGLSLRLNNPYGIRAIASANGANALSVIVPCHRIIGSDGQMVGYAGGIDVKKKLLLMEGSLHRPQPELF